MSYFGNNAWQVCRQYLIWWKCIVWFCLYLAVSTNMLKGMSCTGTWWPYWMCLWLFDHYFTLQHSLLFSVGFSCEGLCLCWPLWWTGDLFTLSPCMFSSRWMLEKGQSLKRQCLFWFECHICDSIHSIESFYSVFLISEDMTSSSQFITQRFAVTPL